MALESSFRVTSRSSSSNVVPFTFYCVFYPINAQAGIHFNPDHHSHTSQQGSVLQYTVHGVSVIVAMLYGWHSLQDMAALWQAVQLLGITNSVAFADIHLSE